MISKDETQLSSGDKLSVLEKVGYSLGDFAANLVFQTLITYLAYFYTDIYGLHPQHASVIMLGVGLVAGIGFNPLIGALSDRTNSRWGKFRPWILLSAIPLALAALLAFSTPEFNYRGKVVYAVVTYTILLFLYAANNLPYAALSGVITGNMKERNSLSAYRFVAVMFAQFFVQVFMLSIIVTVGGGDKAVGIELVIKWMAIIGAIMLLITFATTRERIVPKQEQQSNLRDDLSDLMNNTPWIVMLIVTTLVFITLTLKGGACVYYFENFVDRQSLTRSIEPILKSFDHIGFGFFGKDPIFAGFGLFNACGIIFMIVGIISAKRLADKFGKRDVFQIALLISTLFIAAFYFIGPTSISLIFVSQILHGFTYGLTIPLLWAMIADVADYSEWRNERRATAIIFSAIMVGLKVGLTIGGALLTGLLDVYNYKPNADIVQTPAARQGIKMLVSLIPSIPFIVATFLLCAYKIDKKMEKQIEMDLNEKRCK